MVGRLEDCFLLVYRVEAELVEHLVPRGLDLIRHGHSAFLNIVICRVERMRPHIVPRALGGAYWHVAYRLQVFARLNQGGTLEGLYFLRSDVDNRLFAITGNVFTDFHFHSSDVTFRTTTAGWEMGVSRTHEGIAEAQVALRPASSWALAAGSVFGTLEERERHLKYAPFGLSLDSRGKVLKVAEVIRDERRWSERPVEVVAADWAFFSTLGIRGVCLERATLVAPIDYEWRLGRKEKIRQYD